MIADVIQRLLDKGVITQEQLDSKAGRIQAINDAFHQASPILKVLLVGGSRSSKSFRSVDKVVSRAVLYPGSRHLIARQTFNSLKTAIIRDTFPKVLQIKYPALYKAWMGSGMNWGESIFTLPNGSQIIFRGIGNEKDVERLLGTEFATLFFDECSEINFLSVQKLRTRLAQKVKHYKEDKFCKLMEIDVLNPTTKSHWTYKEYHEHINPLDPEIKLDPNEMISVTLNPIDNIENIEEDYIEKVLMKLPKADQLRFLFGQYGNEVRGSIFGPELNKYPEHIGNYPLVPQFEVFAAFDIGHYDSTGITVFQYYNGKWRYIDCYERSMESWPFYRDWLKRNYPMIKRIVMPHDANNTDWSMGITRRAQAEKDGFRVYIAPRLHQNEQIDIARAELHNCYFNKETTHRLIECLNSSIYDYDPINSVWKSEKLKHDEFSHTTSAFIYSITGIKNAMESERFETDEERHKRIYREQQRLIQNEIDHDLDRVLDPGVDLANPKRRR